MPPRGAAHSHARGQERSTLSVLCLRCADHRDDLVPGRWHPRPANSSIPAYAQTPVDVRPTLRWRGLDSNHQFRESRQRCPHCGLQGRGGGASATVLAPRMVERSPERLFERRRPSLGSSLRGRLFHGGTDGSNPYSSSGESGETRSDGAVDDRLRTSRLLAYRWNQCADSRRFVAPRSCSLRQLRRASRSRRVLSPA